MLGLVGGGGGAAALADAPAANGAAATDKSHPAGVQGAHPTIQSPAGAPGARGAGASAKTPLPSHALEDGPGGAAGLDTEADEEERARVGRAIARSQADEHKAAARRDGAAAEDAARVGAAEQVGM